MLGTSFETGIKVFVGPSLLGLGDKELGFRVLDLGLGFRV